MKIEGATASGSASLTLLPNYEYSFPKQKVASAHRSLNGTLYTYKWATWNKFTIPESWVNSANRSTINYWWENNTTVQFYEDEATYPSSYFSVKITNETEPYSEFVRPYFQQFYTGNLQLETV